MSSYPYTETKFKSVRRYSEGGKDVVEHVIDQLTWYRGLFRHCEDVSGPLCVSAIVLSLPHGIGSMSARPFILVYGDGEKICGTYFKGENNFERQFIRNDSHLIPHLTSHDIQDDAAIQFEKIATTMVEPPPFLHNGNYPLSGLRRYDFEMFGSSKSMLRITSDIDPEKDKDSVTFFLLNEYDNEAEYRKFAEIRRVGGGWSLKANTLGIETEYTGNEILVP